MDPHFSAPVSDIHEMKRALLREGREMVDLTMINPDILPSTSIIDKLHEFTIKPFNHRYAVARGIAKLRQGFATKYSDRFAVPLDADREICAVSGTKDAVSHILHAVTEPGDSIVVGVPTYPVYLTAASMARVNVVPFALNASEDDMVTEIIDAVTRCNAKVVLLNFPNNPTGMSVSKIFYEKLVKGVSGVGRADVLIVNDFVYGEMGFENSPPSLLTARPEYRMMVETYSLSKAYSIPGWRVGAVCGEASVIGKVASLKSKSDYGIFLPLQLAGASVLSEKRDYAGNTRALYARRAKVVAESLERCGFRVAVPVAGACVWAQLPDELGSNTAETFCLELLNREGVALLPGTEFGSPCARFVRVALVAPEERLIEVCGRVERYVSQRVPR